MILISHNMPHVFEVSDRIHIQRLGRRAAVVKPGDIAMSDAVAIMTGALKAAGVDLDFVIELDVSDDEILRRMSGRRVHPASGRSYHVTFNPPRVEGKDDVTGEPLVQRPDDAEQTVKKRIAVYHAETKPLVGFYSDWAKADEAHAPQYLSFPGIGPIEIIRDNIFAAIDGHCAGTSR